MNRSFDSWWRFLSKTWNRIKSGNVMYMFLSNTLTDMIITCHLRYRLATLWKVKRVYTRLTARKCFLDFCIFFKFHMRAMKYIFDRKNGSLSSIHHWHIFSLSTLSFIAGVFHPVFDSFLWKEWSGTLAFCHVRKLGLHLTPSNLVWPYKVSPFSHE